MMLKPNPNQPLVSWERMPSPRPGGDVQPETPKRLIGPEAGALLSPLTNAGSCRTRMSSPG